MLTGEINEYPPSHFLLDHCGIEFTHMEAAGGKAETALWGDAGVRPEDGVAVGLVSHLRPLPTTALGRDGYHAEKRGRSLPQTLC